MYVYGVCVVGIYQVTVGCGCPWNLHLNLPVVPVYASKLPNSSVTCGSRSGISVTINMYM